MLLGRAPITDCTTGSVASGSTASTCERQTEGSADPALFGGTNSADSSGAMKYVQIRYSGYVLSGNSELQSLTLQGVGTGTTLKALSRTGERLEQFRVTKVRSASPNPHLSAHVLPLCYSQVPPILLTFGRNRR